MEGVTNPLLLTPEGKKMGKTERGAIWIDETKISPYDFYQGVYQTPDACVEMMFALFTDLDMTEVRAMIKQDIVHAKQVLSYEITKFIQGEEKAKIALQAAKDVFGGSGKSENMNTVVVAELASGINICDLAVASKLCASKGEAKRLLQQGGVSVNDNVADVSNKYVSSDFENGLKIRKGKKVFHKVVLK